MEDPHPGPALNFLEPSTAAADDDDDDDDDFTFPVPPLAADGSIAPLYPIFGRPLLPPPEPEPESATLRVPLGRLLLEERSSSARQPDDELEGVAPETYCVWAPGRSAPPSPRRCRKSGSTGSVLRWRRISERLVGRSHSDGKEKFVFMSANPEPDSKKEEDQHGGKGRGGHGWSYYGRGGGGGRRRSYLPYKQELVGLFANVSGLRRSYHPF